MYRSEAARDAMFAEADRHYAPYGVGYRKLDGAALAAMEPDLKINAAGALHWTEPWTVTDPGALVAAYAKLFQSLGGTIKTADALPLRQAGGGWSAGGETQPRSSSRSGPGPTRRSGRSAIACRSSSSAATTCTTRCSPATKLNNWLLDTERGYLLAPMDRGVRLTTGAEFAPLGSADTRPARWCRARGPRSHAARRARRSAALDGRSPLYAGHEADHRPCPAPQGPVVRLRPRPSRPDARPGHRPAARRER